MAQFAPKWAKGGTTEKAKAEDFAPKWAKGDTIGRADAEKLAPDWKKGQEVKKITPEEAETKYAPKFTIGTTVAKATAEQFKPTWTEGQKIQAAKAEDFAPNWQSGNKVQQAKPAGTAAPAPVQPATGQAAPVSRAAGDTRTGKDAVTDTPARAAPAVPVGQTAPAMGMPAPVSNQQPVQKQESVLASAGGSLSGTMEITMGGLPVGELKLRIRR
jgi:hypothetical protein